MWQKCDKKLNGLTNNNTDIEFETGKLSIFIDQKNSIHMKGPVSDIKEISILKIDTEGCEVDILSSIENYLQNIDVIYLEYQ